MALGWLWWRAWAGFGLRWRRGTLRGRRGAWWHPPSFLLAGVARQAWHLWHRAGSGGALGPVSATLATRWCVTKMVTKMVCDKVVCERWCVTKMCVKDGVWQNCVWKMVWDNVVCERWCVTKLCVKDGGWQSCVWKMVGDNDVCEGVWKMVGDKDVCVCERWCVTKLCVWEMVCQRWWVTKWCVKDGVWQSGVWKMVCERWCVKMVWKMVCVCDKDGVCVWKIVCERKDEGAEEEQEEEEEEKEEEEAKERRDTESKTRTPHKDVGKYQVTLRYFTLFQNCCQTNLPRHSWSALSTRSTKLSYLGKRWQRSTASLIALLESDSAHSATFWSHALWLSASVVLFTPKSQPTLHLLRCQICFLLNLNYLISQKAVWFQPWSFLQSMSSSEVSHWDSHRLAKVIDLDGSSYSCASLHSSCY